MEMESKAERGLDVHSRSEIRFSSMTEKGYVSRTIAMPLRKALSIRTDATSKTQESTNVSDEADDHDDDDDDELTQTTREDDEEGEEMVDDDSLTEESMSMANSTICTSTLRFSWMDLQQEPRGGRNHVPTLEELQEEEDELSTPPQIGLTTDVVRAFMDDYYTDFNTCIDHYTQACWESFFESRYDRERYIYIRPSGNPLDADAFCNFMTGGNLRLLKVTLISIDDIRIMAGGLAAVVVYTADQDFLFKGKLNRDRSINTAVIEEVNGECKIVQEHRSTAQPRPTQGRWDC